MADQQHSVVGIRAGGGVGRGGELGEGRCGRTGRVRRRGICTGHGALPQRPSGSDASSVCTRQEARPRRPLPSGSPDRFLRLPPVRSRCSVLISQERKSTGSDCLSMMKRLPLAAITACRAGW